MPTYSKPAVSSWPAQPARSARTRRGAARIWDIDAIHGHPGNPSTSGAARTGVLLGVETGRVDWRREGGAKVWRQQMQSIDRRLVIRAVDVVGECTRRVKQPHA